MRAVSIGDLVADYYYQDGKILGVNGGMTSHNIIANLQKMKVNTAVYGVCGNDTMGNVALQSLKDLGVDVSCVKKLSNIDTRCFHVSYFKDNDGKFTFSSKKRCPFCQQKKWYNTSLIIPTEIKKDLKDDDILIFDNLNCKNQEIIDSTANKKMLDLGQYFDLDEYQDDELISKLKNKFIIINLNERVEKYLYKRYELKNLLEIYSLISPSLLIVTRGKEGADFVFDNQLYHKKLATISEEIDSTGAGDAFFSMFIKEYIRNNFQISISYIDNTFDKATKLTFKVVQKMGARGHLHSLYKINKIDEKCSCEDFEIKVRKKIKRCNININNLEARVLNALHSSAYDKLKKIDFSKLNQSLFVGTGGSLAGAHFASRVINNLYAVNTISILPREILYRNNNKVDHIFLFSYSGTTNDLLMSTSTIDNDKKTIITKGEQQNIVKKTGILKSNIISYRTSSNKGKERGFLSFEGTISPSSLFLKLYLDCSNENINVDEFVINCMKYWNSYFDNYFKENKKMLKNMLFQGKMLNIFTGDFTASAGIDLESKIVESGIFQCLVHEKKNFSHGRFINYEHRSDKLNIYFKQKQTTRYEQNLLSYLDKDNLILIESLYDGILCEFDLLIASQYLIYHISKFLNIDISKPTYSEESLKIYYYKGEL